MACNICFGFYTDVDLQNRLTHVGDDCKIRQCVRESFCPDCQKVADSCRCERRTLCLCATVAVIRGIFPNYEEAATFYLVEGVQSVPWILENKEFRIPFFCGGDGPFVAAFSSKTATVAAYEFAYQGMLNVGGVNISTHETLLDALSAVVLSVLVPPVLQESATSLDQASRGGRRGRGRGRGASVSFQTPPSVNLAQFNSIPLGNAAAQPHRSSPPPPPPTPPRNQAVELSQIIANLNPEAIDTLALAVQLLLQRNGIPQSVETNPPSSAPPQSEYLWSTSIQQQPHQFASPHQRSGFQQSSPPPQSQQLPSFFMQQQQPLAGTDSQVPTMRDIRGTAGGSFSYSGDQLIDQLLNSGGHQQQAPFNPSSQGSFYDGDCSVPLAGYGASGLLVPSGALGTGVPLEWLRKEFQVAEFLLKDKDKPAGHALVFSDDGSGRLQLQRAAVHCYSLAIWLEACLVCCAI
jgi:hypothetical protein